MLSAGDVGPEAVGDQDRVSPSQEGDLLRNLQPGLQSTSRPDPAAAQARQVPLALVRAALTKHKDDAGAGEGSSHTGSLLKISLLTLIICAF